MRAILIGLATTALAWGAGAGAAGAATPAAPTVATGSATQLAAHSATVNGTVNANGTATTYAFQYGPTTTYGLTSASMKAGAGTTATAVHVTLGNLVSNSTYHYRVVATSAAGTTVGADATFTTAKAPPTVTVSAPSSVMSTAADVSGTVDPNGKATNYVFEYGPTTSYGLASTTTAAGAGTTAVAVKATLSGLVAGTAYHYRVVAVNADGTSASADATFLTTGHRVSPTGPLPVVSEGAAVKVTAHGVQLNGAINPTGASTTWYFEFGLSADYGLRSSTQTLSGYGARPVNVSLNGLQSGSTYHFRLVALSANGLYVGPDHTFTTQTTSRTSDRLMVDAVARRHGGIVRIAFNGRLQVPSSSSAATQSADACSGTIALQVKQGSRTVALRHAQLRSDCTYRLVAHVPARRLHGNRHLSVVGYFWGNAALRPTVERGALRAF